MSQLKLFDETASWVYALGDENVAEFVKKITDFHTSKIFGEVMVLDLTHGYGRFTELLKPPKYECHTIDVRIQQKPEVVANFNHPPFREDTFHLVFYDPPYLSLGQTKKIVKGSQYKRASIMWDEDAVIQQTGHAWVLREALKLLKKGGILVWKDNIVRYKIPYFEFLDLFIQDLKSTPPINSRTAIKNYGMYAVYRK